MSKVRVRVETGYTIQIGDMEYTRPSVALEIELDGDEDFPHERVKRLYKDVRGHVDKEMKIHLKKIKEIIEARSSRNRGNENS